MVPAGNHEVTFAYRPESVKIGEMVSPVSLVVLLVLTATVEADATGEWLMTSD